MKGKMTIERYLKQRRKELKECREGHKIGLYEDGNEWHRHRMKEIDDELAAIADAEDQLRELENDK